METYCYCDAAYDPKTKIAVTGWKIGQGRIEHEFIYDTNINRAELQGLLSLIHRLEEQSLSSFIIFTDCENIVNKKRKKDEIVSRNFLTKKGKLIANADLLGELFTICTGNTTIQHIKGHMAKHLMNENNKEFALVDRHVRRVLRQHLKEHLD